MNIVALDEKHLANFNAWLQMQTAELDNNNVNSAMLIVRLVNNNVHLMQYQCNSMDSAYLAACADDWARDMRERR